MAATNNDNQGLKIAVACFVMLSVILAVTTYFGFSYYSQTDKKLQSAITDKTGSDNELAKTIRVLNDVKEKTGFSKASNDEELAKAITKAIDELQKKVAAIAEDNRRLIDSYKASGGSLGKLDELKQSSDTITSAFATPSMSMLSSLERLVELLNTQASIGTSLGLEFHDTRKKLEEMNVVNDKAMQVQVATVAKTKEDLNSEHAEHENRRNVVNTKVDALQTELNRTAAEVARLKNENAQLVDEFRKKTDDLRTQLVDWREQATRKDNILDKKDGTVNFVDYSLNEIRSDITRRQGAREQMILSVFDKNAPGIPSDKVKATVQLIKVTDTGSLARIIETKVPSNPIRPGDQLYSAAWSPNRPEQFALIGKMDVNRDGKDDRADVKRMIEAAGGIVAYDLPAQGVGVESGKLTPLIKWYVTDTREAFHPGQNRDPKSATIGDEEKVYDAAFSKAITIAKADGIRPIPLERLLDQLGYSYSAAVPGRVEALDRKAVNNITNPRGKPIAPPPSSPAADAEKKEMDTPPADDPK